MHRGAAGGLLVGRQRHRRSRHSPRLHQLHVRAVNWLPVRMAIVNARLIGRAAPITAALQAYAERGVFRGFRVTPAARGRTEYEFLWLTRKPTAATFDPRRRTLTFPSLLPGIEKTSAAELRTLVHGRTGRELPAHKRLDSRRARITANVRKGDLSL